MKHAPWYLETLACDPVFAEIDRIIDAGLGDVERSEWPAAPKEPVAGAEALKYCRCGKVICYKATACQSCAGKDAWRRRQLSAEQRSDRARSMSSVRWARQAAYYSRP